MKSIKAVLLWTVLLASGISFAQTEEASEEERQQEEARQQEQAAQNQEPNRMQPSNQTEDHIRPMQNPNKPIGFP